MPWWHADAEDHDQNDGQGLRNSGGGLVGHLSQAMPENHDVFFWFRAG